MSRLIRYITVYGSRYHTCQGYSCGIIQYPVTIDNLWLAIRICLTSPSHKSPWCYYLQLILLKNRVKNRGLTCELDYMSPQDELASGLETPFMRAYIFSCDQAALKTPLSFCMSVCLCVRPSVCHTFFAMFLSSYEIKVKVTEVITQLSRFRTEFTYDNEMMHKAWCCLWEVRCPTVFQGHPSNFKVTRLKNRWFWPKLGVCGL